jgi:V/A-type H+-transporting ATPase subunit K
MRRDFMNAMLTVLGCLTPVLLGSVFFALGRRRAAPTDTIRSLVSGLVRFNVILVLVAGGSALVGLIWPSMAFAAGASAQTTSSDPYASLAAAAAVAIGCIAAGLAVSNTGSAAIGTIAEKPETFGRALIFVGLAEGIAIYGLIIAFMILRR